MKRNRDPGLDERGTEECPDQASAEVIAREAMAVAALGSQMGYGLADVVQVLLDCTGHVGGGLALGTC